MKKKWLIVMIATAYLLVTPITGFCSIINEGFEDGLGAWQSSGGLGVIVNSNNPHSGYFSANLAGGPYLGGQRQLMEKAILQLSYPLNLSGYEKIKLSFWYNFFTFDNIAKDKFSIYVKGSDGSKLTLLTWGGDNSPNLSSTGWTNWSTDGWVPVYYASGITYNLIFKLDTQNPLSDYYNPSWGFVDDINVEGETSSNSPIPEPATMSLFGMGLLGLAGYGKRKSSKM